MLSLGMLCALAAKMALRRRGLALGSPPPLFAAIVISFDNLLKILPRLASIAPLKRLTFDHLLCPAIGVRSYLNLKLATSVRLAREMTCEGRNLPRQLIARKFISSIHRSQGNHRGRQLRQPNPNFASKLLVDL